MSFRYIPTIAVYLLAALMSGYGTCAAAQSENADSDNTGDEWENWFENDFEEKARRVNEGQLQFLATPPPRTDTHAIINTITITASSLEDHWIGIHQCHTNLDPVAESQIIYRYRRSRNMRIEKYDGIGKAWVEDNSIQMQDLQRGASLCMRVEAQLLQTAGEDRYILRNGPFFRKFLDGYYPFHLTFTINYPADLLTLTEMMPQVQPGVTIKNTAGYVRLDTWFEGKLILESLFRRRTAKDHQ